MKDMFMHKYILDDKGNPVIEPNLDAWCKWLENDKRHVGLDQIGPYKVSTVFLGLDHNYSHKGPPILWETMVFKKQTKGKKLTVKDYGYLEQDLDLKQDRCSGSREQAEAMHQKMVELVRRKYGLNRTVKLIKP